MRKSWGSLVFGAGFGTVAVVAVVVGCGASGSKPDLGSESQNGDGGPSSTGSKTDASVVPTTCANGSKDGTETDLDCGGSTCPGCVDGKVCTAKTDCLGGACLNKVCVTPACTDKAKGGDETDTDCGGSICNKCTIGKSCLVATDCLSGSCFGASGTTLGACACPSGMATASLAGGGGAYCIDVNEVSKFQYTQFITANVPIGEQVDACKPPVNSTFVPRASKIAQISPPAGLPEGVALAFNQALPVHYVDWCDAYAYCKWANKQLCGGVTGGAADFSDSNNAAKDAWYNACSAQGTSTWPYDNIFVAGKCNGGEGVNSGGDTVSGPGENQRSGYGATANGDQGLNYLTNAGVDGKYTKIEFAQCTGGVAGLFQMSGNVAEWEDSCDSTAATANCHLRGGSYLAGTNNSAALACAAQRTEVRVPSNDDALKDVGFRCCYF